MVNLSQFVRFSSGQIFALCNFLTFCNSDSGCSGVVWFTGFTLGSVNIESRGTGAREAERLSLIRVNPTHQPVSLSSSSSSSKIGGLRNWKGQTCLSTYIQVWHHLLELRADLPRSKKVLLMKDRLVKLLPNGLCSFLCSHFAPVISIL